MKRGLYIGSVAVLASFGCAIDTQITPTRDASGSDTSSLDGGSMDAIGVDSRNPDVTGGTDPGEADRTLGLDTLGDPGVVDPPDAGCTRVDQGCEGNTAVLCQMGMLERQDCVGGQVCTEGDTGPVCQDRPCEPGMAVCSASGTDALVCNAEGTGVDAQSCARGCDTDGCRPETACGEDVEGYAIVGTTTYNLCDYPSSTRSRICTPAASLNEFTLRLELNRRQRVIIDARDADSDVSVDPILYIRSDCNNRNSELVCNDDIAGSFNARIDQTLDAGDYFLFVDSSNHTSSSCGLVQVSISLR